MAKASPECTAAGYAECWTERLCACPCHTASCLTAFPGLKCGFKAVTPAPRSPLAIFRSSWHTLSPQLCTYGSHGSSVLQDASFSASRAHRALLSQSPGWFPALVICGQVCNSAVFYRVLLLRFKRWIAKVPWFCQAFFIFMHNLSHRVDLHLPPFSVDLTFFACFYFLRQDFSE